ncbi:glycosyl hydrolase family 28-related protein [Burkholderia cenocepacia]|uniref:glycosyl hydrolase family 28-related protein n=1 Tax=Burkholderia cenocepacia TaxID=95486 RepID=UPI002AB202BA|nr:glycosyl hydrolase family 28-related protein [Burkholderia cenocepacia]
MNIRNLMVRAVTALLTALSPIMALAQFVPGQILSAGQLNSAFSQLLPIAGGTLTGPLTTPTLTVSNANPALPFNLNAAGTVTRQLSTLLQENKISVVSFGADPTGTNPSATAIQNAINYACASPWQKTVYQPPGTYLWDHGVTINACDGVKLVGSGMGANNDSAPAIQAPTINRWTGPSGGTALTIAAGTRHINNNGVMGIFWDGNHGLGGTAVSIVSGRYGEYDISGAHWSKTIVDTSISTTVVGNADVTGNHFYRIHGYQTNPGDGSFLISEKSSVYADSCWNRFDLIQGSYLNAPAIVLGQNDNDYFGIVNVYQNDNGTAKGIVITGSNTDPNQVGRNTTFQLVSTGGSQSGTMGGIYVQGKDAGGNALAYPAHAINIVWLDGENAQATPVVDSGATAWWGIENAPAGMRQFYFTNSPPGYVEVDNSGVIKQAGQITIPAGSTSGTFTFPTYIGSTSPGFPNAVVNVQVTPATAPTPFSVSATNTTLTVTSSSPGAALTFYFKVEGR